MDTFSRAYANKVVLVTGHTGFKGSWLTIWLQRLGAKVVGISSNVPSAPSNYQASALEDKLTDHKVDIRDSDKLKKIIIDSQPDYVFHLAAQSLVRPSYEAPLDTITTNAIGTANILDSLMYMDKPVVAVMITSDKAYDNMEWEWGYRETDRLGGKDPYSASKGMAELAIRSYVESFFRSNDNQVTVGTTRAGNVIGGGDWATDRIVPDCMRAWSKGENVDIRYPSATRPWQHVLEPLSGYLSLGVELSNSKKRHGEAYNFGPSSIQNYSVCDLIEKMSEYWSNVKWVDASADTQHLPEAGLLKLNCDKALSHLGWYPILDFENTVRMTIEWYKTYYQSQGDQPMYELCVRQIEEYMKLAKSKNIRWAG